MNAPLIVLFAARLQFPGEDPTVPLPPVQAVVPETLEVHRPVTEQITCSQAPARCMRASLADAQRALMENDRPAFDRELAAAKQFAARATAADRASAARALAILDDASNLWDAEFEAPFFAESSPLFATMNDYPGWRDAVKRAVLVDDANRRFYPARESRLFLAGLLGQRLGSGDGARAADGRRVTLRKR